MDDFERILGVAAGFRLAEPDVGQFALDDIDQAAVHRLGRTAAALGQSGKARTLDFEMAQDVMQPVLDPSEIAGVVIGGRFEAFEQIRHALFEMGEGGCVIVADRHTVEAIGQCPQRNFEMLGALADHRRLTTFQRRGQRGDALLEDRERIALDFGAGKLIDLGRQCLQVVAEPDQRVVGRDIGDDGAKCRDGVFELADRRGIVVGAQDLVELGAEIADRLVVTRQLLRGFQRAQHFANFAQRAFDAGQRLTVGAALTGVVDAAGQREDFVFDRFDRPARHRLGNGVTDFRQFAAERGDRLLDSVRTLQGFDLAGDLDEMALERGKIRPRRRCGHHRRCAARRQGSRHGIVKFALARGDLCDRDVERRRAEGRRSAIDLGRRALDQVGLALLVLKLDLSRRRGIGDLRQPRVEARDGVVQLSGDGRLAAHRVVAGRVAARRRACDFLDLAGNGIQPLMNVGDIRAFPARLCRRLTEGCAKVWQGEITDGRIEPVAERHAGAARGGLGPLSDGWIDALNTPR